MWGSRFLVVAAVFLTMQNSVYANPLKLSQNQRWLTVASAQDFDTAIAIANYYKQATAKVVSSKSGWFAVILGPFSDHSVSRILQKHPEIGEIPSDSRVSFGENYVDVLWQASATTEILLNDYSVEKPARYSEQGRSFEVNLYGDEDNPGPSAVRVTNGSKLEFEFQTPSDFSFMGNSAGLLKLDPNPGTNQLVFTRYTGGAHCCTQSWIVTQPKTDAEWTVIETPMLDSAGYRFEDLDNDGALELISFDNSFLYAFDSYADSFAPVQIEQVRGGALIDVSKHLSFQHQLKQDLAGLEFAATLDDSRWRSNGFLVAWLAAKMRLGQGEEAWQKVEKSLDNATDFGPQSCKINVPLDECPAEELQKIPLAQAVAMFLQERDYGQLPEAARALLP